MKIRIKEGKKQTNKKREKDKIRIKERNKNTK